MKNYKTNIQNPAGAEKTTRKFRALLLILALFLSVGNSFGACHAQFKFKVSGAQVTTNDSGSTMINGIRIWNWGDAKSSTSYPAAGGSSHTYTSSGTYKISLKVYDTVAKCFDTASHYVHITVPTKKTCHAKFFPYIFGLKVYLIDSSTGGTGRYWVLGDSSVATGALPYHTYKHAGTYNICLYVYDTNHTCIDTFCKSVTLTGCGTTAKFTSSISGMSVAFTNKSINGTTFTWNFGDGNTSSLTNPSHTYTSAGSYTVCLKAVSSACSDSICDTIHIAPPTYCIAGRVYFGSTTNYADEGKVYLIWANPVDTSLHVIDSATYKKTDSTKGRFYFCHLNPGIYFLKSFLTKGSAHYADYLPTYHDSSLIWGMATPIMVSSSILYNQDIYLRKGTNPGGPDFISGKVSQGANKAGDPLYNVLMLLFDANHKPVEYVYSDGSGNFNLSNLAMGTYYLAPEVLDVKTIEAMFILTSSQPSVSNVDVKVGTAVAYTNVEGTNVPDQVLSSSLFPNPVKEELNLRLAMKGNQVAKFSIMDYTGRVVAIQQNNLSGGTQLVHFTTACLPAGIYIIRMDLGNGQSSQYRFSKTN